MARGECMDCGAKNRALVAVVVAGMGFCEECAEMPTCGVCKAHPKAQGVKLIKVGGSHLCPGCAKGVGIAPAIIPAPQATRKAAQEAAKQAPKKRRTAAA